MKLIDKMYHCSSIIEPMMLVMLMMAVSNVISTTCDKTDLTLRYTECDKSGHRWLVSVPRDNVSCSMDGMDGTMAPKKARNCGEPCEPGTFLNMETQNCEQCLAGTFSRGDSMVIEDWSTLPPGFYTTANSEDDKINCKSEEWIPKKDFISTSISKCSSQLVLSTNLHKPGTLSFTYQLPDDDIFFRIKIINDDCSMASSTSSNRQNRHTKYLDSTGPNHWRQFSIPLNQGHNTIEWVSMGFITHRSIVKIRHVSVSNAIYSMECTKCPAGHFSSQKSSKCSPCDPDTFSAASGASHCTRCSPDQYAFPGSSKCVPRKACMKRDYKFNYTACSLDNTRHKEYQWIEPKLCSDSLPNSVKLPSPGKPEKCSPCPLGTYSNINNNTLCSFCPPRMVTLSVGDNKCSPCPVNTRPVANILYNKWSRDLPDLRYRCLKVDKECRAEELWIKDSNSLRSSPSYDINILQFNFRPQSDRTREDDDANYNRDDKYSNTISTASFDFNMHCNRNCMLHLFLSHDKGGTSTINTWVNSTQRNTFSFHVVSNLPGRLLWIFSRDSEDAYKNEDYVEFYSISMTNLENVGGTRCQFCDKGTSNPSDKSSSCRDCSQGQYYSASEHKCTLCPEKHILTNYPGLSIQDCSPCGQGLVALPSRTLCTPNPYYISFYGSKYDLTPLKGIFMASSTKLFSRVGREYHHVINVSLFIDQENQLSKCVNNITRTESNNLENDGPVCRVTIVRSTNDNTTFYGLQPISLADKYESIQQSNSTHQFWKSINSSLEKHGFRKDETGTDLHIRMVSDRKTDVCRNGRTTTVTLRCQPHKSSTPTSSNQNRPIIMLPPNCPIGTCDGCNFHLLLESKDACPFCRPGDYLIIKEECIAGKQVWHHQPASFCRPEPNKKLKVTMKCPFLTPHMEIAGLVATGILVFLVSLIIYCYRKNKKLEYKYSRLVGGNNVNENDDDNNILPGAESCGMNDGDEDEDDDEGDKVKIKSSGRSGGRNIFAKFNNKKKRRQGNQEDTEKLQMYDNDEQDSADFDI